MNIFFCPTISDKRSPIIAGVVIVLAIFGTSARSIFVSSTTGEGTVEIKQADECIVQASDGIPRKISNGPYEQNLVFRYGYIVYTSVLSFSNFLIGP